MELHSLDQKLDAFEPTSKYSSDKKQFIIDAFYNTQVSPLARHILNILINDLGHPPNQDHINHLSVDDLLTELAERIIIHPSDVDYDHLSIQIEEMATGMCPQGRTIRLYSILFAIYSCVYSTKSEPKSQFEEIEQKVPISFESILDSEDGKQDVQTLQLDTLE